MNVAKLVLGGVAAIGITASCMLCHNLKKEQKEVVTNTQEMVEKNKGVWVKCSNHNHAQDTIPINSGWYKDPAWSKLTPGEAEYLREIIRQDALYGDTAIKPISVDAAKKAYAAAKEAAKHIK